MLWIMVAIVFGAGCVGGIIPVLTGRKKFAGWGLVYKKQACNTWFPGVLGYVLVGGLAGAAFWGIYGPFAQVPLFGAATPGNVPPNLTLAQLVASILVGIGGPDWLQAQSERKCSERLSRNS
jgi:hypothetical protein